MGEITLREVRPSDMDILFQMHRDPASNHMAAFTVEDPDDRSVFDAGWKRRLNDKQSLARIILFGDEVAGTVMKFELFDLPTVGYTIRRDLWGRGIATKGLLQLLSEIEERPLYARAARDNSASIRVLEKCGFSLEGTARGYANARQAQIEEVIMRLD